MVPIRMFKVGRVTRNGRPETAWPERFTVDRETGRVVRKDEP